MPKCAEQSAAVGVVWNKQNSEGRRSVPRGAGWPFPEMVIIMKHKSFTRLSPEMPTEEEIRERAHWLYVQSGWLPGRDLDNWLAAEAFLIERARKRAQSGRRHGARVDCAHPVGV